MKVLVCGSREWVEQAPIERELRKLPPGTIIVHGACRGADNIAGYVAKQLGFEVRAYPVSNEEWKKFGPAAGYLRNAKMLAEEHPDKTGVYVDLVLAFHRDPSLGKGTRNMVGLAKKALPAISTETYSK
jgi:hypothetical protein